MKTTHRARQTQEERRVISPRLRKQLYKFRVFLAVVLILMLAVSVLPVRAVLQPNTIQKAPVLQGTSTLTFPAEADARVQEANRNTNYGTSTYLQVNGINNPGIESYIRFTVSGVTVPIQSARLRVFVTTNGSANGPAVHGASNAWTETGITWNNRPAQTTPALDNKGSVSTNTWVEYNVDPFVTGNGTYTLVLVADSSDGTTLSAREGSQPPVLLLSTNSAPDTETLTPTATQPTSTSTPVPTTQAPPTGTAVQTSTMTPAATATTGPGNTLTFTTVADARVSQPSPTTNYGTAAILQADGGSGQLQISYIRFNTAGIGGSIQSVKLRVFCTTNGTTNGPAVQLANSNWVESGTGGINWNNRPALIGGASDNKASFGSNSWMEYDVTALVTGNGTYTFALVADSTDGVVFSSREGATPPQLVVNLGTVAPTATHTAPQPTSVSQTSTPTSPPSITPTGTDLPGNRVSVFNPIADAYVSSGSPSTNYGSNTQLRLDSSPVFRSYLRFQVEGLNGTVTRATLRVFANTASTAGYEVRSVSNNTWEESTIRYNNSPAVGSVLGTSGSFTSGAWTVVEITSYVTGNGTYNLALTTTTSTAIGLASREVGNNAPQLVIETRGGPPATQTATQTLTSTPTATLTPTQTATPTSTSTPLSSESVVLVGAGDIANCNRVQDEQTAQLLDSIPGTVFTIGDNAYVDGTYTQYINCYDPNWGRHKSRTMPSPGNHDYLTSGAAGYFQYFNNVPSYYAYDLGAWRIYSLNSEVSASATSAQATWLQNDLAANPRQCVLAYWHKARWSSGANHGDSTTMQSIWQILYDAGAELVIAAHEHNYERFAEMNASGAAVAQGLREIVVGTGGAGLYPFGAAKSTSQVRNNTTFGVLQLTLHPTSYDWQFVPIAGATFTDSGSRNCH